MSLEHARNSRPPVENNRATAMNPYYYVNTRAKIEAILRDGFGNEYKEKTTGTEGVYLTDAPGEPDPDYPDDQLLEVILPSEVDISQFEIKAEGVRWREWIVPGDLLNQSAEIRLLPKEEWSPRWKEWLLEQKLNRLDRGFKCLIERGYLEVVRDAAGQPRYRGGQPVYQLSAEAAKLDEQALRNLIECRSTTSEK